MTRGVQNVPTEPASRSLSQNAPTDGLDGLRTGAVENPDRGFSDRRPQSPGSRVSAVRLLLRGWLATAVCLRTTTIGRRPFIAGAAPRVAATLTAVFDRDVVTRQHRCASDESDRVATRTRVVGHGRGREMLTQARPMVCTGHAREHRLRAAPWRTALLRATNVHGCPGGALANVLVRGLDAAQATHTSRAHDRVCERGFFRIQGRRKLLSIL